MSNGRGTDHTYGSRHYVEAAKKSGTPRRLKALMLVDMIGDRDLHIRRDSELDAVADRRRSGRPPRA